MNQVGVLLRRIAYYLFVAHKNPYFFHREQGGVTVLMKAAEKGNLECVKLLFEDMKMSAVAGPAPPAVWVPFYARKRCMNCNEPFSMLVQKVSV